MEIIRDLITRYWRSGALVLGGIILIVYIALGFVYWQQGEQQREFEGQIAALSLVIARPLPSAEKLRADYAEVDSALAPMTDKAAIKMLVDIAKENGINIATDAGNFLIPSVAFKQTEVGGGTYQVLSFSGIRVQGDYDNVIAFISDLDSGKTLPTMVLKSVATSEIQVPFEDEEEIARRAEFRTVIAAVIAMMDANALSEIPNPMSFAGGFATNLMGDKPATEETVEGFPDITTTAVEKGYSGNVTLRDGYVLYGHDRVSTDNTTQFTTVNYITTLTTQYYYTCEADGTVRQFDGTNVATTTEYLGSAGGKIKIVATVSIDIYTKLKE